MSEVHPQHRILQIIIGFAIIVGFFFIYTHYADASYLIPSACPKPVADLGSHLSDPIIGADGTIKSVVSTNANVDVLIYTANSDCSVGGYGGGFNMTISATDVIGVEFLTATNYQVRNFTTGVVTAPFPALASAGGEGYYFLIYENASPGSQSIWSPSFKAFNGTIPLQFLAPTDGTVGTDFRNWSFKPDFGVNGSQTARIRVDYGAGNITDFTDYGDFQYYLAGLTYDINPVPKLNDLSPATGYQAKACLEDSGGTDLFCTETITFDIVTGPKTDYFAATGLSTGGVNPQSLCGDTSFAIPEFDIAFGYTFPRVDIGTGICKTTAFLLVPKEQTLKDFQNLKTTALTKAPFSYFDQAYTIITGLGGSTGTVPTLTYTMSVQAHNDLSVTMFSPTTVSQYAGTAGVTALRLLAEIALYLGFIILIVYEPSKYKTEK